MIGVDLFQRTELMLGEDVCAALKATRVAVFGLGGVGSWCAESLVRSGIGELMLVDSDRVAETNINRQLMATTETVGQVKVEVLAERLRAINPQVKLDVRPTIYDEPHAKDFALEHYDFVIDAIDSLTEKAALIRHALSVPSVTLFSSMGAALKMNPFRLRATSFKRVEGDGLARALRTKFKQSGGIPERSFQCVWSDERRENRGVMRLPSEETDTWGPKKARINGTVAHTTAAFGLALAYLIVSTIEDRVLNNE